MTVEIGQAVPNFTAQATNDKTITLSDLQGKNVVLFFYPKDSTPGCTTEAGDFRDLYAEFQKTNTEVFGISRDSLKSHENFKAKQNMPFELISDPDEELCNLFDVMKLKKMFGREYMGIERSTFLIDASGKLVKEWRKVKVPNHAQEVLAASFDAS